MKLQSKNTKTKTQRTKKLGIKTKAGSSLKTGGKAKAERRISQKTGSKAKTGTRGRAAAKKRGEEEVTKTKAKRSRTSSTAKGAASRSTSAKSKKGTPVYRPKDSLKVMPIGGLNEIGKNLTLLEYDGDIMIIDCGMSFPDNDMFGVDVVIPDFSYIEENANRIKGMVVTHGHEDHIGGIPYLLSKISLPIYSTPITLGLIDNKLKERGIVGDLRTVKAGDSFELGKFHVETIRTTHSVADAICLYITTPDATLFHTGDFKIDYTPIDGEPIDLQKFAEVGERGVDVMLADSTNALRPGFTKSEKYVGERLDGIFGNAKGRIIIATFSSNVHRVQKIIELATKYGRKFSVSGRSMEKIVPLAQELGYIKIKKGSFVDLDEANKLPDNKVVIITTGSQGEPMSALTRMVHDDHKNVTLKHGDTVILSSTPVPGNEKSVSHVVNKLYEKGIEVIYNEIADIHVSGHACQEELRILHSLIRPKYFMPVHGEARHLVEHGRLAESNGMNKDHIFYLSNGDQLAVNKKTAEKHQGAINAGDVLVDGLGIGDVGSSVLKERKILSEAGLMIVACTIDRERGILMSGPEIETRGLVYVKESEDFINRAQDVAYKVIEAKLSSGKWDWYDLRDHVRGELRRYVLKENKRSPMILPIFMEV